MECDVSIHQNSTHRLKPIILCQPSPTPHTLLSFYCQEELNFYQWERTRGTGLCLAYFIQILQVPSILMQKARCHSSLWLNKTFHTKPIFFATCAPLCAGAPGMIPYFSSFVSSYLSLILKVSLSGAQISFPLIAFREVGQVHHMLSLFCFVRNLRLVSVRATLGWHIRVPIVYILDSSILK